MVYQDLIDAVYVLNTGSTTPDNLDLLTKLVCGKILRRKPRSFQRLAEITTGGETSINLRTALPDFIDFILAMFPLAYVFHRQSFIDLHTTKGRYEAMAQNLLHQKYMELVCAFSPEQLLAFKQKYRDATPH